MATPTNSSGNLVDEFEEAFQVQRSKFLFEICFTRSVFPAKNLRLQIVHLHYLRREKSRDTLDNLFQVLHIEHRKYKLKGRFCLLQNSYLHRAFFSKSHRGHNVTQCIISSLFIFGNQQE